VRTYRSFIDCSELVVRYLEDAVPPVFARAPERRQGEVRIWNYQPRLRASLAHVHRPGRSQYSHGLAALYVFIPSSQFDVVYFGIAVFHLHV